MHGFLRKIFMLCVLFAGTSLGAAEIHEAAAGGDLASVSRLLASDSRLVRAKTATRVTPLHYAAIRGHVDVARFLIQAGADLEERTDDGRTPLQFVFENPEMNESARAALTGLLASGTDIVNSIDGNGLAPLHHAALLGNASAASILIGRGAMIGARDAKGNTALHLAAECGDPGDAATVASLLIAAGAAVNATNSVNVTPLHAAVLADIPQEALIRLLVKSGANLSARDSLNQTPMRAASSSGNFAMASLLAELGAPAENVASGAAPATNSAAITHETPAETKR